MMGPATLGSRLQFFASLLVTAGLLAYLLLAPGGGSPTPSPSRPSAQRPVRVTPAGTLWIDPTSPFHSKLEVVKVAPQSTSAPVITVTGTVVASQRSIAGRPPAFQFESSELLTTYTEWQKATADITFATRQLESIQALSSNRTNTQSALVKRLEKLVAAGTEAARELTAAQAELLTAEIQGRKDVHEAQAALRVAERTEAATRQQLQQAGLDPDLLRSNRTDLDVVVADVPEAFVSRVKLDQRCEARFVSLGNRMFSGRVRSILPALSRERRTLRVLFSLDDPEDVLRPGMFADIGLGTDPRDSLLVPLAGVVHSARKDYLFARTQAGEFRILPVDLGETHDKTVEVLSGLPLGTEIIGQGAILLKPTLIEALATLAHQPGAKP